MVVFYQFLRLFLLFYVLCSTSFVNLTGFYTEDEPKTLYLLLFFGRLNTRWVQLSKRVSQYFSKYRKGLSLGHEMIKIRQN